MAAIPILLLSIFITLGALHFYWGLGGNWGIGSTVPRTLEGKALLSPTPFHCFVVGAGLLAFGLLVGIRGELIAVEMPQLLTDYGLFAVAFIFLARAVGDFRMVGFFKKLRDTPFGKMDTKLYSPLSLVIGILCVLVQVTAP
ncbi:MAG: DUF3995 domain-containing protein [Cytophagales bacterium]|nr:DUF3995 domain-containing protein [Cytophagales bacterium]